MKYLGIIFLLFGCATKGQQLVDSNSVKEIVIRNGTNNRYIPDKILVSENWKIKWIVTEINKMKLLDSSVDIKNSFGVYDLKIKFNNGSTRLFIIIYTKYDGVIIEGYNKAGTAMDQFYKNDRLEMAVLRLFQP